MSERRELREAIAKSLGWIREDRKPPKEALWHVPLCPNGGVWRPDGRSTSQCGCYRSGVDNYDTDEAANARLLEAMREKFPYLSFTFEPGSVEIEASGCGNWENFYTVFKTGDRKIAIVDAYAKWKGLA